MKVLVCGGRDFSNRAFMWIELDRLHAKHLFTALIQGGARGADALASEWAAARPGIQRYVCKADWDKHGKAAGPMRNKRMLEWKPDLVVAFEGGRGTLNMVTQARDAGVPVVEPR